MEVTREVILDLLPLYVADEASSDTRALVDEFLETDPELADIAKQWTEIELTEDVPVPLTREGKMEAYREAKRYMFLRTVVLSVTIAVGVIAVLSLGLLAAAYFVP